MTGEFQIVSELKESLVCQLLAMYHHESWSKERKLEDVKIILQNSNILAIINREQDEMIVFARFLSDGIYRAFIYDVIVSLQYRGLGWGRVLLESLISDQRLKNIERVELYCRDQNVPFYQKFGFQEVPAGTYLMRKTLRS
jgi:ribosomal protein S18 acetylase RimI-like enzyme